MDAPSSSEIRRIPVVVDKSHLITIGEKLYTEKTSFLRELVNNAFDADATEVYVEIRPTEIVIHDNGSGMSEDGLRQYFRIGGSTKREETKSPRLGRTRIGEFGIGKFAALAAANVFEVETVRGDFHAKLAFDKTRWSGNDDWSLDVHVLPTDPDRAAGTIITLREPNVSFFLGKVRRYLAERTPIHVRDFAVFLNGERVTDNLPSGERLPVQVTTPYGDIRGHLTILPMDARPTHEGIAVRSKGVLIRYESFGLAFAKKAGASRITGSVDVDFVPITSSRDDFGRDSEEFAAFCEAMRKEIAKALSKVRHEHDRRVDLQSSRVLKDALSKIGRAMKRHGDLFPAVNVPMGDASAREGGSGDGYDIGQAEFLDSREALDPELLKRLKDTQRQKGKKGTPHVVLGKKSVIRNLRVASLDIAVRLEHLGNEDASLISGGVIYINLDHPLYRMYQPQDELLTLHVARLITKELTLHAGITDAAQAFALQDELLTEALRGSQKMV